MAITLPETRWPSSLVEEGPPEDPSILLGGEAEIGKAVYRLLAVRLNPSTLGVDYRGDVDPDAYAEFELDDMLEELTFLDDINRSVLVPMASGHYVIWMMPASNTGQSGS